MVNPNRTESLNRIFGHGILFLFFALSGLMIGCSTVSSDLNGQDSEARKAGSEALLARSRQILNGEDPALTNNVEKVEAACKILRLAGQLDPDNTAILDTHMLALIDRKRLDEAYALAQSYLVRHPEQHELRFAAACCADAANRPEVAAEQCAILYAKQPENRQLADSLVRLYFLSKQDRRAFRVLREMCRRHADAQSAALAVKWAVYFTGQEKAPERALACLAIARAADNNPVQKAPMVMLEGECRGMLNQPEKSIDCFLDAYQADDAFLMPVRRLGELVVAAPQWKSRVLTRIQASALPELPLLFQAAVLQAEKKRSDAIALLQEAKTHALRRGYFSGEEFYLWLFSLLDAEKRNEEAMMLLTEAYDIHRSSPEIRNTLAYIWSVRGEHLERAHLLINEVLQAVPHNAAFLDTKGWILFKLNRPYDALQYLLKAAEQAPDEPEILDHTGDVLAAVGRKTEAVEFWKKCQKLQPSADVEKKLK